MDSTIYHIHCQCGFRSGCNWCKSNEVLKEKGNIWNWNRFKNCAIVRPWHSSDMMGVGNWPLINHFCPKPGIVANFRVCWSQNLCWRGTSAQESHIRYKYGPPYLGVSRSPLFETSLEISNQKNLGEMLSSSSVCSCKAFGIFRILGCCLFFGGVCFFCGVACFVC